MFTALKPTESDVIGHLLQQSGETYSYAEVGATLGELPSGFDADRHRVLLGHGEEVFRAGCEAIRQWKMFPKAMCELYWPDRGTEVGTTVDVLFRAGPFWSLNPARIVYAIDEVGDRDSNVDSRAVGRPAVDRFGFAYGTLPDHLECGEESFSVEWNRDDDSVWYQLYAVSKAQHTLAWLGYPYIRICQARFRRLSGEAMIAATNSLMPRLKDDSQCYSPLPS